MDGAENVLVNDLRGGNNGITKLTVVLVIICLVVSTVAIILAATSLSREGTTINVDSEGGSWSGPIDKLSDDVWVFAIGHDGSNIEYIDDTTGTLRGFHVDIVEAVCAQANKNCRLVWDVYNNCWTSKAGEQTRGGQGLMGGWYDACTGWFNTYERSLTFQFSNAFRKKFNGVFYVSQGNPNNFDPTNISPNQKIGFGDGWATDEFCLGRNSDTISGVPLDPAQIVHYTSSQRLVQALNNNEVVAVFSNENTLSSLGVQQIGPTITNCQRGGGSMMSPKHSTLNDWWNPAFDLIKQSGTYRDICSKIDNEHGSRRGLSGDVVCLD